MIFVYLDDMNTIEVICTILGTTISVVGCMVLAMTFLLRRERNIALRDKKIEDVEIKIKELPCERNMYDIATMRVIMAQKFPEISNAFSIKHSPRQLNDIGERIYEEIKGEEFINANIDLLFGFIREANPKTAYDIEQQSYMAIAICIPMDIFNVFKDYVYNAPLVNIGDNTTKEITLNDVCFILSIPLRDKYMIQKTK